MKEKCKGSDLIMKYNNGVSSTLKRLTFNNAANGLKQ